MLWRFADLAVASDVHVAGPEPAAGPPRVDVRRGVVPSEGWTPVQTWPGDAGEDWLRIERGSGAYRLRFAELTAAVTGDGSAVTYEPRPEASEDVVAHLLVHQVVPLAVSRLGRMVVHACAVQIGDDVVALIGESGAGKSTLAAACCARGALLVADDALVVAFSAAGVDAWPTADGVRLWSDMAASMPERPSVRNAPGEKQRIPVPLASGPRPVRRLFLVGDTSDRGARVEAVSPADARVALLPHLFRLDITDAGESRRLFDDVHRLAERVPARTLVYPDGVEHLDEAVDAMLHDLRDGV